MPNHEHFGMLVSFYNHYEPKKPDNNIKLVFVLEGGACVKIGEDIYKLHKDDVILFNSGQSFTWDQKSETMVCEITITQELLNSETGNSDIYFWCNSAVDKERDYKELRHMIGDIMSEYSVDMELFSLKKRGLLYLLLDHLLNRYVLERKGKLDILEENKEFTEILEYIQEHYAEPLSLGDVASHVFMNDSTFSRYFKKNAGINFLEYLNNIRLNHALEDLLHTGKPLTEIALDNGFTNPSMFSKAFKKAYGYSPTEYKKNKKLSRPDTKKPAEKNENGMDRETLSRIVDASRNREGRDIFARRVQVNAGNFQEYRKVWNMAVNVGVISDLLLARMQKHVCDLRDNLGFTYVRLVNVFGWEMQIRKDHSSQKLNFELMDNVLDFLVSNGMKPILDFGDKPKRVFINSVNIIYLGEEEPIFQSVSECRWMVDRFISHIVHRYGVTEVESWIFDLWNDPRAERNSGYSYLEIFNMIRNIIKSYAPAVKVGGSCMELGTDYRQGLSEWKEESTKPDFLSVAAFPYKRVVPGLPSAWKEQGQRSTDRQFILHEIQKLKQVMAEYGMADVPLILSEWNLSMSDRNFYNDSAGKAAQMLMNMTECMTDIEMGAYLYATDLNARYYDTTEEFFGGTGLLSKDGLAKPSYYALRFMNQLGPLLVQRGDGYIVTTDIKGNYDILMFHYKNFSYRYFTKKENEITGDDIPGLFTDEEPLEIEIEINGVSNGHYRIKTTNMGVGSGSVVSAWRAMGYDWSLNQEEQDYLKRISIPRISIRKQQAENGRLVISELLQAHDIRLVHIYK